MSQYATNDRPVILSRYKRDVIKHGRPLDPMGSFRSLSPCFPKKQGKCIEEKHGDATSRTALTEYQKSANENLIEINNNLSSMLKETCSGIDSICQKVRMCLMEANTLKPLELDLHKNPEQHELGQAKENLEASSEEKIIEIIEEDNSDIPDNTKRVPNIKPFITILDPPQMFQETSRSKLICSLRSKLGIPQRCTTENFPTLMKRVEKLGNYEQFITCLVDDVNREINDYYTSMQHSKENRTRKKRTKETKRNFKTEEQGPGHGTPLLPDNKEEICEIKKIHSLDEHWSDNDLLSRESKGLIPPQRLDYSVGDVYRKRAITNLNARLIAQVEANDSLIFFQKLMIKHRKHLVKSKPEISQNSSDDFNTLRTPMQSLMGPKGPTKPQRVEELGKKYENSLWFKIRKHGKNKRHKREKKRSKRSAKNGSQYLPKTFSVRSAHSLSQNRKINHSPSCSNSPYQVSVTNDQPLSDSDRCRIHWMRAKYSQLCHKKLKCLDILDDITQNDLIPLKAEYPRRDDITKITDLKDSYLYKLLYGKGKENKKAWLKLFKASSHEICDKHEELKENPVIDSKEGPSDVPENISSERKFAIRTLSKYIFSEMPKNPEKNNYIVMPVQVFYNHHNEAAKNPDRKLSLLPMKETKGVKMVEWRLADHAKKPNAVKTIYDPVLKKINKEIRIASARYEAKISKVTSGNSWSPKDFGKYCSSNGKSSRMTKTELKDKLPKPPVPVTAVGTKILTEMFRRSSQSVSPSPYLPSKNVYQYDNRKDADLKKRIQREVETRESKFANPPERKLWEKKYAKSVGQKLLSYIEKQPSVYQPPIPKYAQPKRTNNNQPKLEPVKETKQEHMLKQLHTLKNKNDHIQLNIQKAIDVIENKMVDILCKPTKRDSVIAFSEMEKEITTVLSMMKTPDSHKNRITDLDEYGEEVNKISDELNEKLNKILESSAPSSTKDSEDDMCKSSGENKTETPMNEVCYSPPSSSIEEKFTITAISPKRFNKTQEDASPKPKKSTTLAGQKPIVPVNEQVVNVALIDLDQNPFIEDLAQGEQILKICENKAEPDRYYVNDNKMKGDSAEDPKTEFNQSEPYFTPATSPQPLHIDEDSEQEEDSKKTEENDVPPEPQSLPALPVKHEEKVSETSVNNLNQDEPNHKGQSETYTNDDGFYKSVNKIIMRVENVYNQLEAFEEEMKLEENDEKLSQKYSSRDIEDLLSPLICDMKNTGNPEIGRRESPSNMLKSPSYYNVLNFLDALTDGFKEETPVEVYTSRVVNQAQACRLSSVFHQAVVQDQAIRGTTEEKVDSIELEAADPSNQLGPNEGKGPSFRRNKQQNDSKTILKTNMGKQGSRSLPRVALIPSKNKITSKIFESVGRKLGCLKNNPTHSPSASKIKQKVGFVLKKEEKSTQVTPCSYHTAIDVINRVSSEMSAISNKKDEQVSAYLDAKETKSVDKMSLNDDDSVYQESVKDSGGKQMTANRADNAESDKFQKKTKGLDDSNWNNSIIEPHRVKVFYDTYDHSPSKVLIGRYNENSIEQVKQSLKKDYAIKKKDSLDTLFKNHDLEVVLKGVFKESPLLEPLKNLNDFMDSKLLKESVQKRQQIRMMTRRSSCSLTLTKKKAEPNVEDIQDLNSNVGSKEQFLKGIYVFVYLLMFTALNLEYKCVQ